MLVLAKYPIKMRIYLTFVIIPKAELCYTYHINKIILLKSTVMSLWSFKTRSIWEIVMILFPVFLWNFEFHNKLLFVKLNMVYIIKYNGLSQFIFCDSYSNFEFQNWLVKENSYPKLILLSQNGLCNVE